MLRMKRITTIILLTMTAVIVVSNSLLGNPAMLKPVISMYGKVIDKSDSLPIGSKIIVYNDLNEKVGVFKSNEKDGTYFLTGLKPGSTYYLSIVMNEINFERITVDTPKAIEYKEIESNIIIDYKINKIELLTIK